jgi:prevent-host-death family protein
MNARKPLHRVERRWPVQDAKARFSELLEASLKEGPQIVTRRGVEAAVLVPMDEWRRLQEVARPTLKELLLADTPRGDIPVPPRSQWRRRRPKALD